MEKWKIHKRNQHTSVYNKPPWTTPLQVVMEDDVMAVSVKPQGISVTGESHPLSKSPPLEQLQK